MKVSLFVTCLVDQLFPQVALSAVKVLEKMGVEVDFDSRQTCCGQPAFNSGFTREARQVAERFLEVYDDDRLIVVPSGSCTTMLKVFLPHLFEEGSPLYERALIRAENIYEFSDFLVSVLNIQTTGAIFPEKVTYHDSCHQLRELGVSEQPRQLIRGVEGIELREMESAQRCCGFGGTFSVKFHEVSSSLGKDKIKTIQDAGVGYVISNDVSCLMHLDGLLRRQRIPVQTMHLAELLARFD